MPEIAYVIPFRDRGIDPYRQQNLDAVLAYWLTHSVRPLVVDDGRSGEAQFNRSAAYNKGWRESLGADVYVFTESDMIVPYGQILEGVEMALERPGLVVPFVSYKYLSEDDSNLVRANQKAPEDCAPARYLRDRKAIGAVNILSAATVDAVGQWDEKFEGSWWDDDAMRRAFEICAGRTRWIEGDGYHLYHLPGWQGNHLTAEDRKATQRNQVRYDKYRTASRPEQIRSLTSGAE